MSNRLYQGVIHQMKDAIDRTVGVIDEAGVIVASSDPRLIGESRQGVREELSFSNDAATFDGFTYRFISVGGKNEGIVFVEGEDAEAGRDAAMLAVSLGNIKGLYDEKYDKGSFIKNIMLDNILPSDIYIKSKELHFSGDDHRVVLIIKFFGWTDVLPYDMVSGMFPDKSRDYVINIGESDVVLVKEVEEGTDIREIEELAAGIAETLNSEFYTKVSIGISSVL